MDDTVQINANRFYAQRVTDAKDMTTTAGRYAADESKLPDVWKDIAAKLDFSSSHSVFDIGCGYGFVTKELVDLAATKGFDLVMMDIPEVVAAVEKDFASRHQRLNIRFLAGNFPGDFPSTIPTKSFDRILIYSVIHYTSEPVRLIQAAVDLLAPGGRCLVGDIPNLSKKGRFLSSRFGREFDARYKGIDLDEAPRYARHHDFMATQDPSNPLTQINDTMIERLFTRFRDDGLDVYVLPQPMTLPFCYTREDLLICKPD